MLSRPAGAFYEMAGIRRIERLHIKQHQHICGPEIRIAARLAARLGA